MPQPPAKSTLVSLVHGIQAVLEDAIWLVWYERGVWEKSQSAVTELTRLEKVLKECYDVIDLVTIAALDRFGDDFRTEDENALKVLRAVMAELDDSLLGPVQRGPSQRQFRRGSLKPTKHLLRLAKRNAQKVVNILEDVNETLLEKHSPRLARRRSGSWVPTPQETKKASMNASMRLRRTSSMQMEVGSFDDRMGPIVHARRTSSAHQGVLTHSSQAALARQYSTRSGRKSSLFYTDCIQVLTGPRKSQQLNIQIQRGSGGPLKYSFNVPHGTSAAINGVQALSPVDTEKVTVFHDPFASARADGNVQITIDLSGRHAAGGLTSQRRQSQSLPTSPTNSADKMNAPAPLSAGLPKSRKPSAHKPNLSSSDFPGVLGGGMRRAALSPRLSEAAISPRGMLSPNAVHSRPSPRASPASPRSYQPLSPGLLSPSLAEALAGEGQVTESVITRSSLGSNMMTFVRSRASSRPGRNVSLFSSHNGSVQLYSTANGPVSDVLSIRSGSTLTTHLSPTSDRQITAIEEDNEKPPPTPAKDVFIRRRRSSSVEFVRPADLHRRRRSTKRRPSCRHSTTIVSPLRTFFDEGMRSPAIIEEEASPERPADSSSGSAGAGGVRVSTISAAPEPELQPKRRFSIPAAAPWNDYLGFCTGAFWAQAELEGAMVPAGRPSFNSSRPSSIATSVGRANLLCSNRRCGFTASSEADALPILETRGVRVRPRFLVKSHVEQPAGVIPAFRCLLCALAKRPTEILQGVHALTEHLAEHRGDAAGLGDDALRKAHCVSGRRAADSEDFDINLLPPAGWPLGDAAFARLSGMRIVSGLGPEDFGSRDSSVSSLRHVRTDSHELFF